VTAEDSERDQRAAAGWLAARGIGRGDRVGIVAASSPAYLAAALGALRTGVVPVLLDPTLLPGEQAALLADAEPALVLRGAELADVLDGPPADLAPWPLARPMLYTSGTTGTPKGVWSGVLGDAAAAALLAEERDVWQFDPRDVHLVASALHHSAPLRFAAGTLLAGGSVVLAGRFDAAVVADAVARTAPTTTFVAPAHLQRLCALPALPPLGSFRLVAHAGAPCPESLKRRVIEAFPRGSVVEFYGSTEGQFTVCTTAEWEERPGTVGRARPGRTLRTDGDGTVWCRVPAHARFEYWRDPVRTAAAWRGDALTVGDLGRLDGEGYLFLDGRRDDLVITGGVNVYPLEVERALLEHPYVADAAVFGAADERWGQRVCAAVVAAPGASLDAAGLAAWAEARLAPHKRPKDLLLVDAIPTTPTGKVRRSELAARFGRE
jgi:long-chain acyl-CoA synthetase